MAVDPYVDPDSGCLCNRCGIRDPCELAPPQYLETFLEWLIRDSAELNAAHRFREGNGRTQRALLDELLEPLA